MNIYFMVKCGQQLRSWSWQCTAYFTDQKMGCVIYI